MVARYLRAQFSKINETIGLPSKFVGAHWWLGYDTRNNSDSHAAALQGFYKAPIYQWMVERWGSTGEVGADLVTMIINALISVVVYFPILKIIFRQTPGTDGGAGAGPADVAVAPTEPLAEAAR